MSKTTNPEKYTGAFTNFGEVPERYRLETYADQYKGKDTWDRYIREVFLPKKESPSETLLNRVERVGSSWLEHMESCGTHHALATPEESNSWCQMLLDGDRSTRTCYEYYFVQIYQFYDYLKESSRHPHVYNPLLLAAVEFEEARAIWKYRVSYRED